jgi:hypothetical protein
MTETMITKTKPTLPTIIGHEEWSAKQQDDSHIQLHIMMAFD